MSDKSNNNKSNKEISGIGSGIRDAVDDAVNRGDFSGLNDAIRKTVADVTGTAAGTAADALNSFQGFIQGTSGNTPAGQTPEQGRGCGNGGRAAGNVTEQYRQRAAGARHHTTYSSRVSPFLQRRISRSGGIGRVAGGIVCLVMAGFSFLESIVSGLLGFFGTFGSGFFSAMGIASLVFTLGLSILGALLIRSGQERRRLIREYYEYGRIAGTAEYLEIDRLARATGRSREKVLESLEKMISGDMLPAAWFDRQKTTLMLSERMYNEYLRLERERQEQEAEEARAKLRENALSGAVNAAGGEAFADADADLRPKPGDAKLPADARKIVEEGLLYMGRIRAANRSIGDPEISDELLQLETTMTRIIEQIRRDPLSAPNLRRLMVYYLPTTIKLLQAYIELDRQPVGGENVVSTKQEIREALGTINIAFENLLDSLFRDMAWDISSDISVLKTMMAQDGLTGNQMRKAAAAEEARTADQTAAPQTQPSAGFADGYTDELTGGGQAMQTAFDGAQASVGQEGEEGGGIRLKFGE